MSSAELSVRFSFLGAIQSGVVRSTCTVPLSRLTLVGFDKYRVNLLMRYLYYRVTLQIESVGLDGCRG